jgi:para-nitrobenzyl esterase
VDECGEASARVFMSSSVCRMPFDRLDNEATHRLAGDPPQELADVMHASWVAFAKTGNPNHNALPQWPRYDARTRSTMRFNTVCDIANDPAEDERLLWAGML